MTQVPIVLIIWMGQAPSLTISVLRTIRRDAIQLAQTPTGYGETEINVTNNISDTCHAGMWIRELNAGTGQVLIAPPLMDRGGARLPRP
jgi:hypothetical protein